MSDETKRDHVSEFESDRERLTAQFLSGEIVNKSKDLYAEFRDDDNQEDDFNQQEPVYRESRQPEIQSVPDDRYYDQYVGLDIESQDEELFPGGPIVSQVQACKKQYEKNGHMIVITEIGNDIFVFRTLNRYEYKQVVALPDSNPIEREEIFCKTCVLWPSISYNSMAIGKGGTPSTLATIIMEHSGFTQQWEAKIL
jgi:hypothetical protein